MKKIIAIAITLAMMATLLSAFVCVNAAEGFEYAEIIASDGDPYFYPHFQGNVTIDPATTQWVAIKYRANSAIDGAFIEIYASAPAAPGAHETINGDGNWNVAVFNVKDAGNWDSNYGSDQTRARFDPIEGGKAVDGAKIDIAWIAFFNNEADAQAYTGTESTAACVITPAQMLDQVGAADANNIKSITVYSADGTATVVTNPTTADVPVIAIASLACVALAGAVIATRKKK